MSRTTLWCTFALSCAVSINVSAAGIFLTASDTFGVDWNLHGFDGESEVFASGAASNSAFHGVTVLGSDVLVADYTEEVIQRFDTNGNLLTPFASIQDPTFLESDSAGYVYTNPGPLGSATATRFDSAGAVSQTFVSPTGGSFRGIDADANGNVYVAVASGTSSFAIEKYDASGTFLSSSPITGVAFDLAIDEAGERLFVVDETPTTGGIQIYGISGAAPMYMGDIPVASDAVMSGVSFSAELGTVFATDLGTVSDNPRGWELALDGTVLQTFTPTGAGVAFDIVRVPEPSTCVIALMAIGGAAWYRRR